MIRFPVHVVRENMIEKKMRCVLRIRQEWESKDDLVSTKLVIFFILGP